jgi:hypothetical protein
MDDRGSSSHASEVPDDAPPFHARLRPARSPPAGVPHRLRRQREQWGGRSPGHHCVADPRAPDSDPRAGHAGWVVGGRPDARPDARPDVRARARAHVRAGDQGAAAVQRPRLVVHRVDGAVGEHHRRGVRQQRRLVVAGAGGPGRGWRGRLVPDAARQEQARLDGETHGRRGRGRLVRPRPDPTAARLRVARRRGGRLARRLGPGHQPGRPAVAAGVDGAGGRRTVAGDRPARRGADEGSQWSLDLDDAQAPLLGVLVPAGTTGPAAPGAGTG